MTTSKEFNKGYLMTAGVLAPAFVAVSIHMAYHRRASLKMSDLLLFAGVSVIGGYFTAKLLEDTEIKSVKVNE